MKGEPNLFLVHIILLKKIDVYTDFAVEENNFLIINKGRIPLFTSGTTLCYLQSLTATNNSIHPEECCATTTECSTITAASLRSFVSPTKCLSCL